MARAVQAQALRVCEIYFVPGHFVARVLFCPEETEQRVDDMPGREASQQGAGPNPVFLHDPFVAVPFGYHLLNAPDVFAFRVEDLFAEQLFDVKFSVCHYPDHGRRPMTRLFNHFAQSITGVSFASRSTSTSIPLLRTLAQGTRIGFPCRTPHLRPTLSASLPRRGESLCATVLMPVSR